MKKRVFLFFMILFLFLPVIVPDTRVRCSEASINSHIDLEAIKVDDAHWEIFQSSMDTPAGSITLLNRKWLMYFLHWRPLTDSNRIITVEYVRNHLLNFWGPSMPFTLTGEEGETEIAGHRAVYVEATLDPNRVRTRFIVWNCEETGRQFTADCNINLLMKTPDELFDTQEEITRSICCHGQTTNQANPALSARYQNDILNISFSKPLDWRTSVFTAKTWFPNGPTSTNGTLWTLIPDSEKRAQLWWLPFALPLNESLLDSLLQTLPYDSTFRPPNADTVTMKLDSTTSVKDFFEGNGTYVVTEVDDNQVYHDRYKFRSLLWNNDGNCYLLVVSMIAYDEIWNRPFDLTPSDKAVEHLLRKEIAPHIKPFLKEYLK